jgi:hypothetical protein
MAHPKPKKWTPSQPQKYAGDPTAIISRSSWETKFFEWCDKSPAVIMWASEEVCIEYVCPTDNRTHRYFPDALIKVRQTDGQLKTFLIEIKPAAQTKPPTTPKRQTKRYITEVMTWGKNSAKWRYAIKYCKQRGWEFKIITEQHLFGSPGDL